METLSNVPKTTSRRSWASYLGTAIFGLVLAELFSHAFVWTYLAGEFEWRNSVAQFAAICVLGSTAFVICVISCCPAESRCTKAFWVRTWRQLGLILIGAIILTVSPEILVFDVIGWRNIAWRTLVVAPLCVMLLAGFWILFAARIEASQELRCVTVLGGIGIGYALLGEFGSIWPILAMSVVTWGYIWSMARRHTERPVGGAVWLLGATLAALVFVHVFLTDRPFGWVLAVLLTLAIPCIVIARLVIAQPECTALSPGKSEATVAQAHAGTWASRLANSNNLLALGWMVVLFWTCCWTEPEKLDPGAPPTVYRIPEPTAPSPDLAIYGVSPSAVMAQYSAEWDRFNAMQFENDLRLSEYREMKAIADAWNALVGNEDTVRQAIKGTSWVAMITLTYFSMRRRNSTLTAEKAQESVSHTPQRPSRSGITVTESAQVSCENESESVRPSLPDGSGGVCWLVRGNDCETGQEREIRVRAWTAEEAAQEARQIGVLGQSFVVLHS